MPTTRKINPIKAGQSYIYEPTGERVTVIAAFDDDDETLVETTTGKKLKAYKAELLHTYQYKRQPKEKIKYSTLVIGDITFLPDTVEIHSINHLLQVPTKNAQAIAELMMAEAWVVLQSESRKIIWH